MDVRIKRFIIFQMVLVITAALFGQLGKANMQNCGIQDVRTLEQLYEVDVTLEYIFEDDAYDNFVENKESHVNDMEDSAVVAIVKPTGNIRPYRYTFCQEVSVEQVISGDKSLEHKTLQIYDDSKFVTNNDNQNILEYWDIKNVMQSGHSYLAFFSPASINEYLKEDIYQFSGSFFSYLDLDNDYSVAITEFSVDLRDVRNIEFFSSSQRTLDAMLEIKQVIIDKYLSLTE